MWRRAWASLKTPAGLVLSLVFLVMFAMYASNDNWDKDPSAPRGDGVYRPILARGDGHLMFLMARSIVLDHDVNYDNDLARFGDPFHQPRTVTGHKGIPHPIGPALAWAPFLAVSHGLSKVVNLFGADIASHGYTMWDQRIVFASTVVFAFGAAMLAWLVMRRWLVHVASGLYGIVAVMFGTSLTYFVTYMPSYAHGLDAFVCAAFLAYWALSYGQWTGRRFAIAGLLLGICALVRITGFSLGIVLALEIVLETIRRARSRGAVATIATPALLGVLALLVASIVFIPQMLAWKYMYGEYLVSPMGPRFMRMDHPRLLEVLFSSRNGWLSTHPIAYFSLIGLVFVPRPFRVVALGLGLATAFQVYVNACVFDWWAGASYGQRRMCSMTFVLIVGLSSLIAAGHRRLNNSSLPRRWLQVYWVAVTVILAWFVIWNMSFVGTYRNNVPPSGTRRMCCTSIPRVMARIAQPVYDRLGNPFALPASAIFAWSHDVPLVRWDEAVGRDADEPDLTLYNKGQHTSRTQTWNLPSSGFARYLVSGFGPSQSEAKLAWRWTVSQRSRLLVPLMLAEAHTFTIPVYPNIGNGDHLRVRIGFDDDVYIDRELTSGWNNITFTVAATSVGMHELWIDATPHLHGGAPAPAAPKGVAFVGVAAGPITIGYPPAALLGETR